MKQGLGLGKDRNYTTTCSRLAVLGELLSVAGACFRSLQFTIVQAGGLYTFLPTKITELTKPLDNKKMGAGYPPTDE
jgi:hypothetical protein